MKIIFVSDAIYPYHKGGKEKRIFELTTRLAKKGHEVHLFTMNWWKGEKVKKENNVILHGVCPLYPIYVKERRSISQAIFFSFRIIIPLLKEKFDILEADNIPHFPVYSCKLICLLKRKKMFLTWHEVWGKKYWLSYLGKKGYFAYLIEKYSTKLPNCFIAVSSFTRKRLLEYFHIQNNKIAVIPNGINIIENKNLEKNNDIFFAGRLLDHKKVDVLIGSVAEIKKVKENIKVVIVGQGPEKNKLKSLIKDLNLQNNINFFDFLPEEEYFNKLSQSKLFISCSIREGFGITVLEALAMGLPVITIDHPENAATELIQNGNNGYIVLLDQKSIAEKALALLNDEAKYRMMVQQALASGKKYNWDNSVNELLEVYKKCI
jgi:glycosyltransferase involved in cell wall biosynthesis